MKIVVRVDSSLAIGSGHVMRCLTLAEHLKLNGSDVRFICRELTGNIIGQIEQLGFQVYRLPAPADNESEVISNNDEYANWLGVDSGLDARQTAEILESDDSHPDWLLMDHYGLGQKWQEALRPNCRAIMVIDDLANRRHSCDLLLDNNLSAGGDTRYASLVPDNCILLNGPPYSLLRAEFVTAASNLRRRDGTVRRILIFLGGVDRGGHTIRACEAIAALSEYTFQTDVVVGAASPHSDSVQAFCDEHPGFQFHYQVDCMAKLMNEADLAIGAGGTTTWERAWLGLPTIILPVADNQLLGSRAMVSAGAAWMLQPSGLNSKIALLDAIRLALDNPEQVAGMSLRARALFGDRPIPGVELVEQAMKDRINA